MSKPFNFPTVCEECKTKIVRTVEKEKQSIVHHCPEMGTLAAISAPHGIIQGWTVEGPYEVDQLKERLIELGILAAVVLSVEKQKTKCH